MAFEKTDELLKKMQGLLDAPPQLTREELQAKYPPLSDATLSRSRTKRERDEKTLADKSAKDSLKRESFRRQKKERDTTRHCEGCGIETRKHKFCGEECRQIYLNKQRAVLPQYPSIDNAALSRAYVYAVLSDLTLRGYEVYPPGGASTVVVLMDGLKATRVQVKAGAMGEGGMLVVSSRTPSDCDVVAVVAPGLVQYLGTLPAR